VFNFAYFVPNEKADIIYIAYSTTIAIITTIYIKYQFITNIVLK